MKEIQGKEVEEWELIVGIRYWIVPRSDKNNSFIYSGIFQGYYRNTIQIPLLEFKNAYRLCEEPIREYTIAYRYWFPYKPIQLYYEIRTLSKKQTKQIQVYAKRKFESIQFHKIVSTTNLSKDVSLCIVQFLSLRF